MVWGTIISLFSMLILFTLFLYHSAGLLDMSELGMRLYNPVSSVIEKTDCANNAYCNEVLNVAGGAKDALKAKGLRTFESAIVSADADYFNMFNKRYVGYAAYGLSAVDVAVFMSILALKDRIGTGVGIIREASKAVQVLSNAFKYFQM